MTYQPDYDEAIRVARQVVGSRAEAVVTELLRSGEMVCVPRSRQGRKSYDEVIRENYALRDWMGVLIDEYCDAVNYQQYIAAAKTLLVRIGHKFT